MSLPSTLAPPFPGVWSSLRWWRAAVRCVHTSWRSQDSCTYIEVSSINRILLSHDVYTMPSHFYTLLAQLPPGEYLPGVLLVAQQAPIGRAIEWIAEVWGASRHEEWRDQVDRLPL